MGNTQDEAARANRLGLGALRAGEPAAAAAHFEQACRSDPGAAELWINLATARRMLQDDQAEREALEQALAADQRSLPALVRLAQLHERLGEEGHAIRRWSAVLALSIQIEDPSPEFAQLLAHGRSFVERQRQGLADALDHALSRARRGIRS